MRDVTGAIERPSPKCTTPVFTLSLSVSASLVFSLLTSLAGAASAPVFPDSSSAFSKKVFPKTRPSQKLSLNFLPLFSRIIFFIAPRSLPRSSRTSKRLSSSILNFFFKYSQIGPCLFPTRSLIFRFTETGEISPISPLRFLGAPSRSGSPLGLEFRTSTIINPVALRILLGSAASLVIVILLLQSFF